ncbi:MAG TPA: DUF1801 domain-containing protein [Gemmatimonas aurantiaca]|uniref:YdhG-like domain-containing protein n=2 Tax=Gemmatimonas aurantiaca TaxID=173480 RepID=C1ADV6_GEMAT|nr:DUF1801 domain-containing protein [Gemmatimonas aurantiaca]BAH40683.1 hypothetical protein GAU_3641 [Gemmatimonas aurantiaca T-27]HCT59220.1 DUF1801 domain-containing protein [Gemmatimonas aurantiaca]
MYEPKTKPTAVSVESYLAAIESDERRADCEALTAMMSKIAGAPARMWGTSIVGFGSYHYKYDSGHEGDACEVGFSSRKGDISIYLMPGYDEPQVQELLAQLGKHRTGKACLYVKRLRDVQVPVLESLVQHSVNEVRRRYPGH